MAKVIVFDFDGTLADTLDIVLDCVNQLSEEFGYFKIKKSKELKDKGMRYIVQNELKLGFFKLPRFMKKLKVLLKDRVSDADMFPGLKEVLENLHKHYKIGILSTNSESTIKQFLHLHNLDMIDFIDSDSSLFGKHHVLKRLLKKEGCRKEDVLYIADEIRDIEACQKIGIIMIAVGWGYNSPTVLQEHNPTYLVKNSKELLELLMPTGRY